MSVIRSTDHLILGPAVEPLSLELVKKQRKFTSNSLDSLFDIWIATARQTFERETNHQIITTTREYWLSGSPYQNAIELPWPPLQSIVSIKYDDSDGVEQTLDSGDYEVVAPAGEYCGRGMVRLTSGASWPSMTVPSVGQMSMNALRIRYKAGYGDTPESVPAMIRSCLLNIIGGYHRYNEDTQEVNGTMTRLQWVTETMFELKVAALPSLDPKVYSELTCLV